MITINKEELIKKYIEYKINSYKVDFEDNLKLDRVEKILECHGWMIEANKAFKPFKEELEKRREILKDNIIEVLKNYKDCTRFEFSKKIESLKEEIRSIDKYGHVRVEATEELFKKTDLFFFDKALILMKLGEIGV
jgi:hypothetical protein